MPCSHKLEICKGADQHAERQPQPHRVNSLKRVWPCSPSSDSHVWFHISLSSTREAKDICNIQHLFFPPLSLPPLPPLPPPAFFNKHPDVFVYRVWKCDRLCDSARVTFIGARWHPWRHVGVWNMLASWCMSPGLLWLFSVALENRAPLLFFFLLKDFFFFYPSLSLKSSTFLLHTLNVFLSPFWCHSGGGRRRRGGSELRGRPQLPLGAGEMVVHRAQQVRGKDRTRLGHEHASKSDTNSLYFF